MSGPAKPISIKFTEEALKLIREAAIKTSLSDADIIRLFTIAGANAVTRHGVSLAPFEAFAEKGALRPLLIYFPEEFLRDFFKACLGDGQEISEAVGDYMRERIALYELRKMRKKSKSAAAKSHRASPSKQPTSSPR